MIVFTVRYNGLHDIIRIMAMSKHECNKLSYVSVEMAAGYQQMIGAKPKTPIWFVCVEGRYGIRNFGDINLSNIRTVFIFNMRSNGRVNLRYFSITCRGQIINCFAANKSAIFWSPVTSSISVAFEVPDLLMCLHSVHRSRVLPVAILSAMRDLRMSEWFLAAQRTKM